MVSLIILHFVAILSSSFVEAIIEVFDDSRKSIAVFTDTYLSNKTIEEYLIEANPKDACLAVNRPSFRTNFTIGKILLVHNTDKCKLSTKIKNVKDAGYDALIIYDDVEKLEMIIKNSSLLEVDIIMSIVEYHVGEILRHHYLYYYSDLHNYVIQIRQVVKDFIFMYYLITFIAFIVGIWFFKCLLSIFPQLRFTTQLYEWCSRRRMIHNARKNLKATTIGEFVEGDYYDRCTICLENYQEADELRILPCSHTFHSECIEPWLVKYNPKCPLCKKFIPVKGLSTADPERNPVHLQEPTETSPLLYSESFGPSTYRWSARDHQNFIEQYRPLFERISSSRNSSAVLTEGPLPSNSRSDHQDMSSNPGRLPANGETSQSASSSFDVCVPLISHGSGNQDSSPGNDASMPII